MRLLSLRLRLVSIFLFLCFSSFAAKEVEFVINAPSVVAVDEVFRVEFSLNNTPEDFSAPSFEGFEVLAGPSTSQGQSVSIVNGNITREVNYTYTYVLQASKQGKFTITPATVKVESQSYATAAKTIEVVQDNSSAGQSTSSGTSARSTQSKATLAKDDVLLRMIVDKKSVYIGEPIRLTLKIYFRVPIRLEDFKYPAFNGFWSQEIPIKRQQSQRETLNSKVYESQVLQQYLLFPQHSGELSIDELSTTIVAQIVSQNARSGRNLIDDFFGAGPSVQEIRRVLKAQAVNIKVKELPAGAPESFTGAVGRFKLNSELTPQSVAANSATTYTLKLSGEGNLPLIKAPKLNLPSSFEQYTMKTTESLNTTDSGISGYRQFEYPFIARAQGEYKLSPVEFSYFDPSRVKYVTLKTPEIDLDIKPDTTGRGVSSGTMISGLSKEDLKILQQDIHFIKLGRAELRASDKFFFASYGFFTLLALILGVFAFLVVFLSRMIERSKNLVFVKGRKANKVALQRFKAAAVFIKQDDKRRFYEEMLRALWGYVSDKLNIPVSDLTKDNVLQNLINRGVESSDAESFTGLISQCEYAQYSPDNSSLMNDYFEQGVALISKYESIIK